MENLPQPSLSALILGLVTGLILTGIGVGFGFAQGLTVQVVILSAIATLILFVWGWRYVLGLFLRGGHVATTDGPSPLRQSWNQYRWPLFGLALILLAFLVLSLTIETFFNIWNVISLIILLGILVLTRTLGRQFQQNRSAFIGIMVLAGLFSVGSMNIEGFASGNNIKSMLLFASFLGIASIGQTLVALLGGLDLSIPFIIGAANVGLLYLISLGVPPWLATIIVLVIGTALGVINGFLSYRLQGQALIVTLGTGFAISGGVQIVTSIGSQYSGNVFGTVPAWLANLSAMNGTTFGLPFPPVIAIWGVIALILIVGMRVTVYGRFLYALGVNRTSASRVMISEMRYWVIAYALSGFFAAMTGSLLLGWSGGGFIGVGDQYLFLTLAAVVVGGTSLLGGAGGYGFTVIGVLVLQVLSSFLVGIGLKFEWQQFIFGLLILPMVALYARSPHIRTQI
ncbi:ABC transporter permease [Rhizobium leguminosarum]|uniref:ABC transporter permease n=1 Tax=Rhizobium leguminosarum TaxID=384 RepID=UPI001C911ACD|nr:ABC transporter permease [Rhizobium leguminosarum]MBY2973088.1 ABC transporter permease [Rhizobium leguminosarum]MBY2980488.1 ABC transporter permease [Rhizobium leguminosarum]MBY3009039.1 ABC transporter permease [Rhizobium leguminosarum]